MRLRLAVLKYPNPEKYCENVTDLTKPKSSFIEKLGTKVRRKPPKTSYVPVHVNVLCVLATIVHTQSFCYEITIRDIFKAQYSLLRHLQYLHVCVPAVHLNWLGYFFAWCPASRQRWFDVHGKGPGSRQQALKSQILSFIRNLWFVS